MATNDGAKFSESCFADSDRGGSVNPATREPKSSTGILCSNDILHYGELDDERMGSVEYLSVLTGRDMCDGMDFGTDKEGLEKCIDNVELMEIDVTQSHSDSIIDEATEVIDQGEGADFERIKDMRAWLDDVFLMNYLKIRLPQIDDNVLILDSAVWALTGRMRNSYKNFWRLNYHGNWSVLIIPIFLHAASGNISVVKGNHWTLAVVRKGQRNIDYYDSMRGTPSDNLQNRLVKIVSEVNEVEGEIFVDVIPNGFVRQRDSSSCGPIVCMLAEKLLGSITNNDDTVELDFGPHEIMQWRNNAYDILSTYLRDDNDSLSNANGEGTKGARKRNCSKRLTDDFYAKKRRAEDKRNARASETPEQRNARLASVAASMSQLRDNEIPEQSDARLTGVAANMSQMRTRNKQNLKKSFRNCARMPFDREDSDEDYYFDVGNLTEQCKYCAALFFKGEHVRGNKKGEYNVCCNFGKKLIENPYENFPERLYHLFVRNDPEYAQSFHANIRQYNSMFAFGSMRAQTVDHSVFPFVYRVQGQIQHVVNTAFFPDPNEQPRYAQLFYLDTAEATNIRMQHEANESCDPVLMRQIDEIFKQINLHYDIYMKMHEVQRKHEEEHGTVPNLRILFDIDRNTDMRRYNLPIQNEIAAVFQLNDDEELPKNEGIAVHLRGKGIQLLKTWDKRIDSMLFPMLFPSGRGGCKISENIGNDESLSVAQYYRNLIAIRKSNALIKKRDARDNDDSMQSYEWDLMPESMDDFNPIRMSGKLYQQWLVNSYVRIEQAQLHFIKKKQHELKAELYQVAHDYFEETGDDRGRRIGRKIILPPTFKGGPRSCRQAYLDSMTIVRHFGKPDLFITFTCNPNWREIQENLMPGNHTNDEPDLVCRVFNLKLRELMDDLKNKEIFGKQVAWTYVVEFQKRGLPHAHILLILDKSSKIQPGEIDKVVWAEVPDPEKFQKLYQSVLKHMIHGPCGHYNAATSRSPCMVLDQNGNLMCSKGFPRAYCKESSVGKDSYATYIRRESKDLNYEFELEKNGITIDNRWVVPYNPYVLLKYDAHINVEICASVKCVKYLYKYIYKGHDCIRVYYDIEGTEELEYNEIRNFVDMRYVGSHEAFWRIQDNRFFKLDERSHSVMHLDLHLPNNQVVYYDSRKANLSDRLAATIEKDSMLLGWFKLNQRDDEAKKYFYHEIPMHYTWDRSKGAWHKKGGDRGWSTGKPCLGRMFTVSPKEQEKFWLRKLLVYIRGATGWQDLLMFEGKTYNTFFDAAKARGLVDDENEWKEYLNEVVAVVTNGRMLREMFVSVINHADNINVKELWDEFKEQLYEDFLHLNHDPVRSEKMALVDIERMLQVTGYSLKTYKIDLPKDVSVDDIEWWTTNRELEIANNMLSTINPEQKVVFDYILEKVDELERGSLTNGCIYINGKGGCGKTFVYRLLCHWFRAHGIKYKTASWMGMAANEMLDGRTMHKSFGLPFDMDKHSSSKAQPNNKLGRELMETDVFMIDEISMVPNYVLNIVNRKMQELSGDGTTDSKLPFGGKVFIIGGDFCQILPVERYATKTRLVNLSVRNHPLWKCFKVFHFLNNERVNQRNINPNDDAYHVMEERREFSEWLLKLGKGELPEDEEGYIEVPERLIVKGDLIGEIFGELIERNELELMSKRVIMTLTNDKALEINNEILSKMGDTNNKIYESVDTVDKDEPINAVLYPTEFLHSLNEAGLPPHELKLRLGCPVMLLRNLNPAIGLCNGTRLKVVQMHRKVLECEYMFGERKGQIVLIPRIVCTSSERGKIPFKLCRMQFPVRACYAMTINKSQGQTIEFAGLDMTDPVFAHGMTYVGCSRVRIWDDLKIKTNPERPTKMKNIVWKEVLINEN